MLEHEFKFMDWAINNLENIQWSYTILEEYNKNKIVKSK